ncbi:protein phosphatase 1H-like isoform X2 [Mya arenaria]|uniref:protein phosphatase 1H-like isoform X2 n=1 Tax=Mya arenaria TaxID=6604 RepID=UPI0022E55CA8|nr:protein phosphatase 1H-like isoform X2 [Mya arenaria]
MLGRFKDATLNAMGKKNEKTGIEKDESQRTRQGTDKKPEKYINGRPYFLGLSADEVQSSIDFAIRPILKPRKIHDMPLFAGYAECLNGGKSDFNEDNSYACEMCIRSQLASRNKERSASVGSPVAMSHPQHDHNGSIRHPGAVASCSKEYHGAVNCNSNLDWIDEPKKEVASWDVSVEGVYFGMFDGHAGYQTSLIASRTLHGLLQEELNQLFDILAAEKNTKCVKKYPDMNTEDLIVGALEESFQRMDHQLKTDGERYNIRGGCTALVALFVNGKLYVANAGDSRAVLCHGESVRPVSRDLRPDTETEKLRINLKGSTNPGLLRDEFSCLEFQRRVIRTDIGTQMLCRKPGRKGWCYKIIEEEDLRYPLVVGTGKGVRLMGTIGVSRSLGDHDLYIYDSDIWIKPFLSSLPEVQVVDLRGETFSEKDVLIMGTDGLWDVTSNENAALIVRSEISQSAIHDKHKDLHRIVLHHGVLCRSYTSCSYLKGI